MFRVELTFKGYDNALIFCIFIFIFCLEPTVREQLDENDFRLSIFFRPDHSYVRSSFATIRRHSDNEFRNDALQLKILGTWVRIGTNYFLSKFLETKIDESAWKILYTIIRACSSKNIAPRYFTYCMLLFLSNKPSF